MSRWSAATATASMGRNRGYGSEYGSSYDAALDGARGMRGLTLGALGSGIRAVGMGQAPSRTTYGSDPWGSGPFGRLGQATPDPTIAVDAGVNVPAAASGAAGALASMSMGTGALAALGTGLSGATSGALVGAIAGGKGNRLRFAGRGALAGAVIANVAATIAGGIAWAGASQLATAGGADAEAVKSGAMTFTLANAGLAVLEIGAMVLTKAAR